MKKLVDVVTGWSYGCSRGSDMESGPGPKAKPSAGCQAGAGMVGETMSRWDLDWDNEPTVVGGTSVLAPAIQAARSLAEEMGVPLRNEPEGPKAGAAVEESRASAETVGPEEVAARLARAPQIVQALRPIEAAPAVAPAATPSELAALLAVLPDGEARTWMLRSRREGVTERFVSDLRGRVEREAENVRREAQRVEAEARREVEVKQAEERRVAQVLVARLTARRVTLIAESRSIAEREDAVKATRKAVKAQTDLTPREVHAVRLAWRSASGRGSLGTALAEVQRKVEPKLGFDKMVKAITILGPEFGQAEGWAPTLTGSSSEFREYV